MALLTVKPQFGIVLPLLLVASGRWRCFAAACTGTATILGATAVLFGPGTWGDFLASLGDSAANLSGGGDYVYFYTSLQSVLNQAGAPPAMAWTAHGLLAIGALLFALILWRQPSEEAPDMQAAVALAAVTDHHGARHLVVPALLASVEGADRKFNRMSPSMAGFFWAI
jgi:hypothetical protein